MQSHKTFKKILLSLLFFSLLVTIAYPATVKATISDPLKFQAQVGVPGLWKAYEKTGDEIELVNYDTSYIAKMIQGFYNYGIGIAGILAAIMLMAGGLIWLTSAGSSEKITQAKNIMIGSVIGLVMLFGSWMLLRTINPALVDFKITDIDGIEKIEHCCHPTEGWVAMESINNSFSCPPSSQQCTDNKNCIKTNINIGSTDKKRYACLDLKEWQCCEYKDDTLGIEHYCNTKLITSSCEDNMLAGTVLNKKYEGVICDPDGGGTKGIEYHYGCYYGGEKCCECKSDSLTFGFTDGAYMKVSCQDNLTAKQCRTWCIWGVSGVNNMYTRPSGTTCQSNGYCK